MNFAGNGTGEKKIKHKSNDNLRTRGNRCFLFLSFSKSKSSNYVTKEQIERARNVDMVEFLERTEGFSVKKSGNGYRCDKHDSLFITNDRRGWY